MMSQRSKRELLQAIRPRYLKTNKAGKTRILDEFVAATGYHRKHADRLLKIELWITLCQLWGINRNRVIYAVDITFFNGFSDQRRAKGLSNRKWGHD
jgi:hypothetical protein